MKKLIPIKIRKRNKAEEGAHDPAAGAVCSSPPRNQEAQAQFVEVEPGIYDIVFTCVCGHRAVIRCQSVVSSPNE